VWGGAITNDTFGALRAFIRPPERRPRRTQAARPFRSRRLAPPSAEGRWSLLDDRIRKAPTPTEASAALAQQLLSRYGVLTREVAAAEGVLGGFSAVYDVLKAMEDAGKIRRG
jgi:ATP-dependent Lhr-like helicase